MAAVLADLPERYSVSVPPVTNNIYRSAAPAQNYLPERRSAAFRHHYRPARRVRISPYPPGPGRVPIFPYPIALEEPVRISG